MRAKEIFEAAVEKHVAGEFAQAKAAYQKLLRVYPNNSEVLGNLAACIKKEGKFKVAEQLLERSLRANPNNISAMATLANIRISDKNYDAAAQLSQMALSINPQHVESLINWGIVQVRRNQLQDGQATFQQALKLDPKSVAARINYANCLRLQRMFVDEVAGVLEGMLQEHPDNADILFYLAQAYQEKNLFVKALHAIEHAIRVEPREDFHIARANALVVLGEFEEAIDLYTRALKADSNNNEVGTAYLFSLNYDHRKSQMEVFEAYRDYGSRISKAAARRFDHSGHESTQGRKIRVGYCSPDLCGHVVAFFITPIIMNQDHSRFEYFAYANVGKPDAVTERLKPQFDHWIDTINMSDEELAQRIYDDKIDILIDLAGHTAGSRISAFGLKPAPVQVTYLGYGYTTGMNEIDYFIGDEFFTPEGCEPYFSEKVFRVPSPLYAYQPPIHVTPPVAELPALKNGYITFGTMSRIVRINNDLLRVWKRIIDRVPNSRLRIDQKPFEDHDTIDRFLARLESIGYSRDQVDLVSSRPHWAGYHQMDIALDCWPHNAGTTTFESLWMGVPVVSKRDRPSVGRLGDMVLQPLGLSDWIADTEEEFVEKAVHFASDIDSLAALRLTLRDRIKASPFTDFPARTKALEDAYIDMIRRFEENNG